MNCSNRSNSENVTVGFFLLGKIYCFTSDELLSAPKTGDGRRQLPVLVRTQRLVIDKDTYNLAISGGLDQLMIKLVETNTPGVYTGHVMDETELNRVIGLERPLTIWGGLIEEILHLQGGKRKLEEDPSLRRIYPQLQAIEQTRTVDELLLLLRSFSISEREQNRINSPLLDQLLQLDPRSEKTAVESAITKGNLEALKFLVERGATMYRKDFIDAAAAGRVNIMKYLHDRGISDKKEALVIASENGHINAVRFLLDHGANVQEQRALFWASQNGHIDIVELLLDRGANVHTGNDASLSYASQNGHTAIVKLLIDRGSDGRNLIQSVLTASENGHNETVKLLLDRLGGNRNLLPVYDQILVSAARGGNLDLVKSMMAQGADIHTDNDAALIDACMECRPNIINFLLEHKFDVHANDDAALIAASATNCTDGVRMLLEHGADVHARNDEAIIAACSNDFLQEEIWGDREHRSVHNQDLRNDSRNNLAPTVELILNQGVNVHARNDEALLRASAAGHAPTVELLLNRGANVHAQNDGALREAITYNNIATVELLLDWGATVNDSLIDMAREHGFYDLAKLLIERGNANH